MKHDYFIGWDVGGAHLKFAVIDKEGNVTNVGQKATPLWKGIDNLVNALLKVQKNLPVANILHAVTTTAELTDIFTDKQSGLLEIAKCLDHQLQTGKIYYYAGSKGWFKSNDLKKNYRFVASANWHATASFTANIQDNGILIDIGSTTTDIIPFSSGKLLNQGYTDYQRLSVDELVYTGIIRTPVFAIIDTILLDGVEHPVIPEFFATMADIYRLTGELDEQDDMMETADGAEKSVSASTRRLARIIGSDTEGQNDIKNWKNVASMISARQQEKINHALDKIIARSNMKNNNNIVGAGAGRFLAKKLARVRGLKYVDFADLCDSSNKIRALLARSATAVSIAQLARSID